jgi:hypothetical protein
LQQTENCQRTCRRTCGPRTASGSAAAATCRRSLRSMTAHMRSSSAACAPSSCYRSQGRLSLCLPPQALQLQHADGVPADPRTSPAAHRCRPAAAELPPPNRKRRRVRFDLTPQPAAADSGTVFPAQPCRFFERPEEATKSRYPRRQCGPPPALKDYSFFLSHRDQEAEGTYVESRPSLRTAPHHPCTY